MMARQHSDPTNFIRLADEFATNMYEQNKWKDIEGAGLNMPASMSGVQIRNTKIKRIHSEFDLQALAHNHCILPFMEVLLRHNAPSANDNAVYSKSVHEILSINEYSYDLTVPSDLIALVETCDANSLGPPSRVLSVNSPAEFKTNAEPTKRVNFPTNQASPAPVGETGVQGSLNNQVLELMKAQHATITAQMKSQHDEVESKFKVIEEQQAAFQDHMHGDMAAMNNTFHKQLENVARNRTDIRSKISEP